jgi:hypothetical protein
MNVTQQKTLHQLTGHSNIADAGVDELFQLTDAHPYFSVPHFFLTKKLKDMNHQAFIPQLQKSAVYFNNPYWLHYQLMPTVKNIQIISKHAIVNEETKPLLQHVIEEEIEQSNILNSPVEIDKSTNVVQLEKESATVTAENYYEEKAINPIVIPTLEQVNEITNTIQEEKIEDVATPILQTSITSFALESAEVEFPVLVSAVEKTNETSFIEQLVEEEEQPVEEPASAENIEMADIKITSILKDQLEEFKKPVTEETALIVESEPYHTVDYFASQGIKHDYDQNDQDKLSKQLRKFTDWLKHMKNAPPKDDDLGTDPELDSAIQGIAQTSNEAKEIVTETMAEVLVKQGKIDKAIQLYIKLSFLNPDKSAYFASKIQILKGI